MPKYSQANRPFQVNTALGPDQLLLAGFSGEEWVSRPFVYKLDLLSESSAVAADSVLRKPAAIAITLADGSLHTIHGVVTRFVQLDRKEGLTSYRAEVRPWLWFLSLGTDCHIHQNLSVPEIVEKVFKDAGYTDFKFRLSKSYPKRDYCVQYRETNLAFVSRLMEDEGIFYFFEFTDDKHVLIVGDTPSAVKPNPGQPKARMAAMAERWQEEDVVTGWEREQSVHSGKVTLRDYNFQQPSLQLESNVTGKEIEEVYDYPGKYAAPDEGARYARLRLEAYEAMGQTVRGTSTCRAFSAGSRFDLTEHYHRAEDATYMLTYVSHRGTAGDYRTWETAPLDYKNEFTAIPYAVPYRPALNTARPLIAGSQTAVVVGPAGEEIYVDKHGRVKIQFFWDRLGKKDDKSSCWVRVSTAWGGKGWGMISIPRIGQEVIVDFLEGDPDLPIITGRVYNAEQVPPYPLPGGMVVSGGKSQTHKGKGYNEMSMDDTAGKEKVTIHAQYDMGTTVEHDQSDTVKNNRTITVDGTHTETIKKATSITVSEGNYSHSVAKGTSVVEVKVGTHEHKVKGKVTETYLDAQATTVTNDIAITSSSGAVTIDASKSITLHTGSATIELKASGEIKIHGTKIEIIGDAELKESAPKVDISGGTEAKIGVGSNQLTLDTSKANLSGAAISASAVGVHEITGAVVKIN
jgi:type VI secretion system secreted protein VgrG